MPQSGTLFAGRLVHFPLAVYIKRVPAAGDDDCKFAPHLVSPMREIFRDLVLARGLQRMGIFRRLGIVN
jgi:hypothetical protein